MKGILVIDDNDEVRTVVADHLTLAGYYVREARDGREGIQQILLQKPDLILCDVKMPGVDGFCTLSAIRKTHATTAIPFILMTGSGGHDAFRRGMSSGADDFLAKPFTPDELLAAVESRLVRQTELQWEAFQCVEKLIDAPTILVP